jgi:hypothetical protein
VETESCFNAPVIQVESREGINMAATTNGFGAKLAGGWRAVEAAEQSDSIRYAQSNFLDELPGAAFALITLAYIVTSFMALL